MFLGISVLSLNEITYFVTLRLFWMIRHWKKSENSVEPSNHEVVEMNTIEDVNQSSQARPTVGPARSKFRRTSVGLGNE